jgi:hypothetical protein
MDWYAFFSTWFFIHLLGTFKTCLITNFLDQIVIYDGLSLLSETGESSAFNVKVIKLYLIDCYVHISKRTCLFLCYCSHFCSNFCTVVCKLVLAWDQVICPLFLLVRLLSALPAIFLLMFLNFMVALVLLRKYIKTILKYGVLTTHTEVKYFGSQYWNK